MLAKQWILIGAISGFFAVVFGAFGGHALKETLSPRSLAIYQIAVQYHMYHALALIGLGVFSASYPSLNSQIPGAAFTFGLMTFSGSLYALALTELSFLGMITPIGGLSFLVGWASFAYSVWKL
jgi:uncharacterized membrane protein YgdD (TMEM256/DUF423 family)